MAFTKGQVGRYVHVHGCRAVEAAGVSICDRNCLVTQRLQSYREGMRAGIAAHECVIGRKHRLWIGAGEMDRAGITGQCKWREAALDRKRSIKCNRETSAIGWGSQLENRRGADANLFQGGKS